MLAPLTAGSRTDLQILLLQGGVVDDRGDHLVVRAPHNPGFHWGNYVAVTTGDPDDVERWLGVFRAAHPDAAHVALGLPRLPSPAARERYAAHGLEVSTDEVLVRDDLPQQRPLPAGYTVRELVTDDDWRQVRAAAARENALTDRYDAAGHDAFTAAQVAARRELAATGRAVFLGAFAGDALAADLGIVALGDEARYQSVGTDADHRRRGLAGHLLGVAATWAAQRGCRRFVICTESTNPAGRLYRSVGFAPDEVMVAAYRAPAR